MFSLREKGHIRNKAPAEVSGRTNICGTLVWVQIVGRSFCLGNDNMKVVLENFDYVRRVEDA